MCCVVAVMVLVCCGCCGVGVVDIVYYVVVVMVMLCFGYHADGVWWLSWLRCLVSTGGEGSGFVPDR